MGHLRTTAITGDRANADGEEMGTEEGAAANPTGDKEDGGGASGGAGVEGEAESHKKTQTSKQMAGGDEQGTEKEDRQTASCGKKGRGTEKRGPKRSRAADGDVVGLVHLLRYIHGYQRTTSKRVREEMRRTGCGAAWERRDWNQYTSEGREGKEAAAEGDEFDSGDEDGGAGGGRRGRAETTR